LSKSAVVEGEPPQPLKTAYSRRFAQFEDASRSRQRLNCGGLATAFGSPEQ